MAVTSGNGKYDGNYLDPQSRHRNSPKPMKPVHKASFLRTCGGAGTDTGTPNVLPACRFLVRPDLYEKPGPL